MLEAAPVYPKFERTQSKETHLLVVDPADIHFDTGQIYFLLFRYCLICIKVFPLLEMSVFMYGLRQYKDIYHVRRYGVRDLVNQRMIGKNGGSSPKMEQNLGTYTSLAKTTFHSTQLFGHP